MSKYNFQKRLSATDIIEIGKSLGLYIQVYARNGLPNKLTNNGLYVINLDDKNSGGTHWVCFAKQGKQISYMDSFGMPPPQDEINAFQKDHDILYYNTKDIQDLDSILCGYFCLAFLHFCNYYFLRGETPTSILSAFSNLFSKNTKLNDGKVKKYMNSI